MASLPILIEAEDREENGGGRQLERIVSQPVGMRLEACEMAALTHDDVVAMIGSVEDTMIAEVLAMGATREELAEAHAWVTSDEALMNAGRPLPSGRVGRLVEILRTVEDESPAVPTPE